jgi:hypothetical protein
MYVAIGNLHVPVSFFLVVLLFIGYLFFMLTFAQLSCSRNTVFSKAPMPTPERPGIFKTNNLCDIL